MSMSLDGFITGPNDRVGEGMGEGGERLHDWMFNDSTLRQELSFAAKNLSAHTGLTSYR